MQPSILNSGNSAHSEILQDGFTIIPDIFRKDEIEDIIQVINSMDIANETFRKSNDLFAVRQFLREVPEVKELIFNDKLKLVLNELFGSDYLITKSIYFDKPAQSNWFVPYHQDLTISVDKKIAVDGYDKWTLKQGQFAVQPPIDVLESSYTVRIHLDDTDEHNGALKVIPGSHLNQIFRPENIDWQTAQETICRVPKGGLMIMKPLLLHSSNRTTNEKRRRVIHIEFCNKQLLEGLKWAETDHII